MIKMELTGEVQVVEEEKVHALSLCGYEIVGVYQEQESRMQSCQSGNQDQYGNPVYRDEMVPSTSTRFLMRLNEDAAVKWANEDAEKAKEVAQKARLEVRDTQELLKEAKRLNNQLRGDVTRGLEVRAELGDERDRLSEQCQRMETDLAKIREAIGTQRMDEILAVEGDDV